MDYSRLMAVAAALSLIAMSAADATSKQKRPRTREPAPASNASPDAARSPGVARAMYGSCYTDEGYGRYWPCGAGPK